MGHNAHVVQKCRCDRRRVSSDAVKSIRGAKKVRRDTGGGLLYYTRRNTRGCKRFAATGGFLWMGRNAHAAQKVRRNTGGGLLFIRRKTRAGAKGSLQQTAFWGMFHKACAGTKVSRGRQQFLRIRRKKSAAIQATGSFRCGEKYAQRKKSPPRNGRRVSFYMV